MKSLHLENGILCFISEHLEHPLQVSTECHHIQKERLISKEYLKQHFKATHFISF